MIRDSPRLPLVGDRTHDLVSRANPKTKTFLRRKKHGKFVGFTCLPLVGLEAQNINRKGDSPPDHLPAGFRLILR